MYSTCLFCSGALGRNESIEHFAVGRRLAFDAAKGRLWVICLQCNRWNLTPLESRWEAIEEAERAYRATKLRSATEHIGLAKLKEGTELVRIGRPLLPELAAWRYGEVFNKRWRRNRLALGASLAASVAYAGASLWGAVGVGLAAPILAALPALGALHNFKLVYDLRRVRTSVTGHDGQRLLLSLYAGNSHLLMDESGSEFGIDLVHTNIVRSGRLLRSLGRHSRSSYTRETTRLEGEVARRALGAVLPLVNLSGASAQKVSAAVTVASTTRGVMDMLRDYRYAGGTKTKAIGTSLVGGLPPEMRLAMEMVTHEEDERRALDGELHALETRWREAEEIAAIADRMFLPADVDDRLARWRQPRSEE